jgi:hypothetical protein
VRAGEEQPRAAARHQDQQLLPVARPAITALPIPIPSHPVIDAIYSFIATRKGARSALRGCPLASLHLASGYRLRVGSGRLPSCCICICICICQKDHCATCLVQLRRRCASIEEGTTSLSGVAASLLLWAFCAASPRLSGR